MFVQDILKTKGNEIVSLTANQTVLAALELLASRHIGAVLVLEPDGSIAGILSERDVVHGLHRHGKDVLDLTVGDLMTTRVVTCTRSDPVAAIMGMMTQQRFRHVPVVEDGNLIGLISIGDVVKSRIEEAQAEVEALRLYISL
jgi:CBS domain-containing protein